MYSDAHANSPDKDVLRAHLSRWAARLTPDPAQQERLTEQTIAFALHDPDVLNTTDVVDALKRVMQNLALPGPPPETSASPRE